MARVKCTMYTPASTTIVPHNPMALFHSPLSQVSNTWAKSREIDLFATSTLNGLEDCERVAIELIKQNNEPGLNELGHDDLFRTNLFPLIYACGEFDNRELAIKLLVKYKEQSDYGYIESGMYLLNFLGGLAKGGHTNSLLNCFDHQFKHQGVGHADDWFQNTILNSIANGKTDTMEGILDYVKDNFKGSLPFLLDVAMDYINSEKKSLSQNLGVEKYDEIRSVISKTRALKDLQSNKGLREDIVEALMFYSTNNKFSIHQRRINVLHEIFDLSKANPSCMLELLKNQKNKVEGSSKDNFDYEEWCRKTHPDLLINPELFKVLNHVPLFKEQTFFGKLFANKGNIPDCVGVLDQCIQKIEEHYVKQKHALIESHADDLAPSVHVPMLI